MNLPLHPKYGVNPTMCSCIICGKDTGEIALLGNHYKGEAPHRMVTSVVPCDDCKAKYLSQGTMLIAATMGRKNNPVPTGAIAIIKDEAYERAFGQKPHEEKMAYVTPELLERLLKEAVPEEKGEPSGN